ncbi:MAG: CD225/dispanin family protein [Tannerella sp.]|nr:CD225/dispanin family protein [Tannerella sp.]
MDDILYYYMDGNVKKGPFSLATLKHAPVRPDTPVWNKSLPDWVEARMLPELQPFFAVTQQRVPPPPLYQPNMPPPGGQPQAGSYSLYSAFGNPAVRPPMPDNYMVWAILTTICCCMPLGIVSLVHSSKVNSAYLTGNYEEARMAWSVLKSGRCGRRWRYLSAACCMPSLFFFSCWWALFRNCRCGTPCPGRGLPLPWSLFLS